MARLADDLFQGNAADPLAWLYNFGRAHWARRPPDRGEYGHRYREYIGRVRCTHRFVADRVTAALFRYGVKDWGQLDYLVNCLPFRQDFWVESGWPSSPEVELNKSALPRRWGWYVEAASPDQIAPVLADNGATVAPGLAWGLALHLAMETFRDTIIFPVASAVVQVDGGGKVLAEPSVGFPYAVDDRDVYAMEAVQRLVQSLLLPTLVAICFANSPLVDRRLVSAPEKLQAARRKRKKPELLAHYDLDPSRLVEALRYEGQAGILGIDHAMRACARHFTPDDASRTFAGKLTSKLWIPNTALSPFPSPEESIP